MEQRGRAGPRPVPPRDLRDLQVWSNLAWVHPLVFEKDPELAEFRAKGRHYTEEEKHWFLGKQRALLARVIPLHRELAERGQVELTTTPYYHPILPLLLDKGLAREAMPDVALPAYRGGYPEDAAEHVRRAVESHAERFGEHPRGMWPSEGSVCQAMIPLLAEHGIQLDRDRRGDPRPARPTAWSAATAGATSATPIGSTGPGGSARAAPSWRSSSAIIRCPTRSGSTTSAAPARSPPPTSSARSTPSATPAATTRPTLVPVILDGENCWEYYPDGGVSFLRSVYQGAVRDPRVRPVRVDEFLARASAARADTVPRLFAGSWISHNFAIWIGHPEDNRGWDALHAAREFLVNEDRSGRHDAGGARARPGTRSTSPRAPTGSGGSATTTRAPRTRLFDHLFRKHLRNVYTLLGCDPPGSLFTPISQGGGASAAPRPAGELPRVKLDGRAPYFEWIDAARYACGNDRGTMTLVARGVLRSRLVRVRRRAAVDPRRHRGRPGAAAARRGRPAPHRLRRPGRVRGPGDGARLRAAGRLPQSARLPDRSTATPSQVATGSHPRAGRPVRPARPEPGRPDPVLRRAVPGATPASTGRRARASSS